MIRFFYLQNFGFNVEFGKIIKMEIQAIYRIVTGGECWDQKVVTPQLPQLDTHEMYRIMAITQELIPFKIDEIFGVKRVQYSHIVWLKPKFSDGDYKTFPSTRGFLIKRIEECGWVKVGFEKDLSY